MKNKVSLAVMAIVAAGIIRLLPHPHNLTPIGAMALTGGAYLGRKYMAFIIPFVCLFITDFILNNTVNRVFFTANEGIVIFGKYMLFTYAAFALTVLLGSSKFLNSSRLTLILGGAVVSSVLFFVLTNFGTWLTGGIYPKNIGGLLACYAAGIPFYWNTLLSNLVFTFIIVMGIESAYGYFTAQKVRA